MSWPPPDPQSPASGPPQHPALPSPPPQPPAAPGPPPGPPGHLPVPQGPPPGPPSSVPGPPGPPVVAPWSPAGAPGWPAPGGAPASVGVDVPPPPAGPGVQVPFGAPPGERDRRRLWIGLGVGGALLALCCVGGIFGFGALLVQTSRNLTNQATTVVTSYLGALRDSEYAKAYEQLCAGLRRQVSLESFAASQREVPRVLNFTLDAPQPQGSSVWVQAHVNREDGPQEPAFRLVQEGRGTVALKICGITQ
jgi:hypothetical protein